MAKKEIIADHLIANGVTVQGESFVPQIMCDRIKYHIDLQKWVHQVLFKIGDKEWEYCSDLTTELVSEAMVQKWISVKDRLPELETYTYSVDVLFNDYEEGIHVGYVCLETGTWKDKYSRHLYAEHKVTHWMPLPEPPTDLPRITNQTMDALEKMGEKAHGGE